ncbi:superoxide dismutase family protein [Granulicella sp. L60]|uniref:superoxide dismutase family protein n=1 Tax=Granulicella sp. L60 TaxID=1641866 RepID=UPI00131C710E|nr:superoxide dismutase family protein [Granulicella sp. L60]
MRRLLASLTLCLLAIPALAKPKKDSVVVSLKTSAGEDAGTATFSPLKNGVKIKLDLKNLPVGEHAVHVHTNPKCDAPDFKTAGGHFNPDGKTVTPGVYVRLAGDLPNSITIGEGHIGQATYKVDTLSMAPGAPNSIFANGGTSIIVHTMAEDMKTGNAGNRIACGVISTP